MVSGDLLLRSGSRHGKGGSVRFEEVITDLATFREVMDPPSHYVVDKETDHLDELCRDFIARSPFVLLASTDAQGRVDISPRGDAPGFVRILDDTTLAVPDRKGNHRTDTFMNLLEHPFIGLLFLIPGHRNSLRIRGRAEIVRDRSVRESMAVNGKVPELVIGVHVTMAYFHCAKCIIRSNLWGETSAPQPEDRKLLAEAMVRHGELDVSVDQLQEIIESDEVERLY
jgi:PPOX class probable FMN-dependent enzyme